MYVHGDGPSKKDWVFSKIPVGLGSGGGPSGGTGDPTTPR